MFTDMSAEEHWSCMEWNFKSMLNTIHAGIGLMKVEREKGKRVEEEMKVVLTGSVLSMMGFVGYSSYSPSKYAIRGESFNSF
jgi:3-dehydrosphinganine reductase